ncbi:hypothetical protein V1477_013881 [Vespula maculifrons]|uniref:Uncharacterized protein n=1 Tax=Vespula maculifrons TaxID=7453 RepID=A0ABD2BPK9_VESMC
MFLFFYPFVILPIKKSTLFLFFVFYFSNTKIYLYKKLMSNKVLHLAFRLSNNIYTLYSIKNIYKSIAKKNIFLQLSLIFQKFT